MLDDIVGPHGIYGKNDLAGHCNRRWAVSDAANLDQIWNLFTMINGIIYALMKANKIYERGKKVVKTFLSLSLIKVGTKLIKGGTQLLLREDGRKGISTKEEKRLGKEEKEEMENRMDEKLKTMTDAMKKIRECDGCFRG